MLKITLPALLLVVFPAFAAPTVSVGFSPSHTALQNVLSVVNDASTSLDVEAYSFTSKPIATAIIAAKKEGLMSELSPIRKRTVTVIQRSLT